MSCESIPAEVCENNTSVATRMSEGELCRHFQQPVAKFVRSEAEAGRWRVGRVGCGGAVQRQTCLLSVSRAEAIERMTEEIEGGYAEAAGMTRFWIADSNAPDRTDWVIAIERNSRQPTTTATMPS